MMSGIKSVCTGRIQGRRRARVLAPVVLTALGSCGLLVRQAHATNGVWSDNAASGGLWNVATNWGGGNIASGIGAIATFNVPSVANTVHMDLPYTLGGIAFNNSSTSLGWTIDSNGSSSNILTLATSVGVPTITTTTSGSTSIITAPLAGTQGFTFSGAGNLQLNSSSSTISGPVSVVSAAAGGTYLQDYSTATLANATSLYMTAGTSGTSGMQFLGGVTVPSTVPATFNMNSGGRVDFDSVGSGTVTFNNSILITNGNASQITEFQLEGANMTFNGNVTLTNYANPNFQLRATAAGATGIGTFNGNLTLPAGVTLLLNQDGGFNFVYVLNGTANSFTLFGETYGTIKAGVSGALPAASVYSDATAGATSGLLDLFGTNQTITGLNENSNGNYTIGSSSNTSNSVLTLNNSTGNTYNFRGSIVDDITTSGLTGTKTVALALQQGTQTLSGADTFSGGTTITGGTLNANSSTALGAGFVTVNGPGTLDNISGVYTTLHNLTLNGATITANSGLNSSSNGAFGLPGTVTIGGTAASSIASGASASNNYVQIGSTTTGSTTTFNVGSTGASGADFTVNVPIANYQSGTGFVATANLTKTGAGIMQVTGSNTYTGTTNISAGTLQLASGASITKSPLVLIGPGATFDTSLAGGYMTLSNQTIQGLGTIRGVVTHNAGLIQPIFNGTGGTLTFNDGLTLNGGSLTFNLGATAGLSTNGEIAVTAANGLTDNASSTPLSIQFSNMPSGTVTYPLFTYNGTLNGNWSTNNFAFTTNAGRDTLAINTTTAGVVSLVVTPFPTQLLEWNGSNGSTWDVQTTKDWNNLSNAALTPDYFYNGDAVIFDDNSAVTSVTLNATILTNSVTVSSNTNNYTISGSGSITGSGGLTKTGSSYLTLETSNAYTGPTNISGGTLDVGGSTSSGSLGTGVVNNNSVLVFSRSDGSTATPVTVANTIAGSGSIVFTGAGITSLTGPVTQATIVSNSSSGTLYVTSTLSSSGGVVVNTGTLNIGANYNGTGGATVNGGLLVLGGSNTFTGNVTVNGGYLWPTSATAFGAGSGPVTVNTGGEIYTFFNNNYGNLPIIINGTGPANDGALRVGGSTINTYGGTITAATNSLINLDGGATLLLANTNMSLQSLTNATVTLTGAGSVTLNGSLNLGAGSLVNNLGGTLSFNITTNPVINVLSTISGSGSISVNGLNASSGQVNFTVDNSYTGNTTINSGILAITTPNGLGAAGSSSGGFTYLPGGTTALDEVQFSGNITVGEYFELGGKQPVLPESIDPHLRSVSGNNTLTGAIVSGANGNQYNIQSDSGLFTIAGGYTQTNGGTRFLNLMGAGNGLFTSSIANSTGADAVVSKFGTGTWTLGVSNSYAGPTNVSAGKLVIAAPGALPNFTGLNLTGGLLQAATYTGTKNSLFVNSLSFAGGTGAWVGTVDLTNNDMVVRNGSIGTINNQVAQGYNNGNWNGTGGILSSTAALDSTHLTALGAIQNTIDGTVTGSALIGTFDNMSVGNNDVLIKYTYYGDTDLNGQVDGTDYSRIDFAYLNNQNSMNTALTGWFNGDFNYDGVIDGSDYTLMDNAFNMQGAQISSQLASPTAELSGSAVPEPATLSLLGIAATGLLGRRSRRNHQQQH